MYINLTKMVELNKVKQGEQDKEELRNNENSSKDYFCY